MCSGKKDEGEKEEKTVFFRESKWRLTLLLQLAPLKTKFGAAIYDKLVGTILSGS